MKIKSNRQSQAVDSDLWNALREKYEKSSASTKSCRHDVFRKSDHDDHPDDDALLEGEKGAKRQKTLRGSKSILEIDEDKGIPEDETPELLNEFKIVDKQVPTICDHKRMEATMKGIMSNQFRNAKEYACHIEQAKNYMENQIALESRRGDLMVPNKDTMVYYGPKRYMNEPPRYLYNKDPFYLKNKNTEEKKYVLSLHKIHATSFLENDLEEKLTR
ncbi:hypothetical protein Tco_1397028 [Tanacetum coccineum]